MVNLLNCLGIIVVILIPISESMLDPVPIGKFEATDRKENFANYKSSLLMEFKGFAQAVQSFQGKVIHEFGQIGNSTYFHAFSVAGTAYKQNLTFELGNETLGAYNGTDFKYRYYFEPGQGLHADFNVPADNPMQIQHFYALDDDELLLVYKIGDVIARRWYTRLPLTHAPPG